MSNDKYQSSPEEIKAANNEPVISKIRIGTTSFDITSPKDWTENREAHRAYIHGRTHYEEQSKKYNTDEKIIQAVKEGGCTHTFKNTYENNVRQYKDLWQPTASWFSPGKKYQIQFNYEGSTELVGELILTDSCFYEFKAGDPITTIAKISWDASLQAFELTDEQLNSTETLSKTNIFTIKPVLYDSTQPDITTYDKIKRLDSKFIPVDNKTIKQNSEGVLQTDSLFEADFRVSRDFGKHAANTIVKARGKTLTQVIQEAFCEDLGPEILEMPEISSFSLFDKEEHNKSPLVYEVGETVNLALDYDFNPGKYSYGTVSKKESNISIDKVQLYLGEELIEVIEDQTGSYGSFVMQSGTFYPSVKISYKRDSEDYAVSSFGSKPQQTIQIKIKADIPGSNEPDVVLVGPEILGSYRYFWDYRQASDKINFESDNVTLETFTKSRLTSLPETIETDKAIQWFFAVPKTSGITSIELCNQYSGANVGLKVSKKDIELTDAGKNPVDYLLFYMTNTVADVGLNNYRIKIGREESE